MSSQTSVTTSNDAILDSLWSVKQGEGAGSLRSVIDNNHLEAYFSYCQKQFKRAQNPVSPSQILFLVRHLRSNKLIPRRELKLALIAQLKNVTDKRAGVRDLESLSTNEDECNGLGQYLTNLEGQEREGTLDDGLNIAASIMLAVHVTHDPNSIEPGRSKIQWEDLETFESFVGRAFPKDRADDDVTPVKPSKLRAMYFEAHAGIQLQWTEHLYDHLLLSTSENSKVLKVFQLPCMLEAALEVLKHAGPSSAAQRPDALADNNRDHEQDKTKREDSSSTDVHDPFQEKHSNDDCLVAGASHVAHNEESKLTRVNYSLDFLYETLMTLQLLFPEQDRKKLKGKSIRTLAWLPNWLNFTPTRQKLDARLYSTFVPGGRYQRPLANRHELYERYPHWGLRLHILLEEVEDPTPLSWIGRWTERRKAARHSFWVTFGAFVVAIAFGLAATVLGGVQVWISYCQWQGEAGGGSICRVHGPNAASVTNNTASS